MLSKIKAPRIKEFLWKHRLFALSPFAYLAPLLFRIFLSPQGFLTLLFYWYPALTLAIFNLGAIKLFYPRLEVRLKVLSKKQKTLLFSTSLIVSVVAGLSLGGFFLERRSPAVKALGGLLVVSTSPSDGVMNADPSGEIIISFSEAVDPHILVDHFLIRPEDIKLEWVAPSDPEEAVEVTLSGLQEVKLKPPTPFPNGKIITIGIAAGMPSINGKILEEDYFFSFTTKLSGEQALFSYYGTFPILKQFPENTDLKFVLQSGEEGQNLTVRVFKVGLDRLLDSLVYNAQTKDYYGYTCDYNGCFLPPPDKAGFVLDESLENLGGGEEVLFNKPRGIYYAEIVGREEKILGWIWLVFSRGGILFRQDDQRVVLASQDLLNGDPVSEEVKISLYNLGGAIKVLGEQSFSKEIEIPYAQDDIDLLVGQREDDLMVVPVNIPQTQAELNWNYTNLSQQDRTALYTDRPLYKPGDTVSFWGILRKDNDALYRVPSSGERLLVRTSYYGWDYYGGAGSRFENEQEVSVNGAGVFSGEIQLPFDLKPGDGYISVARSQDASWYAIGSAGFEVSAFKKPDFFLSVSLDKSEYVKGDVVRATVKGSYTNGQPLANQILDYEVFIRNFFETSQAVYNSSFKLNSWGGMCGGGGWWDSYYGEIVKEKTQINLSSQGTATIEFPTASVDQQYSQTLTFVFSKKGGNGVEVNEAVAAVVHQGEFNIFTRLGKRVYYQGEILRASFDAEDLAGVKLASKEFSWQIASYNWNYASSAYETQVLLSGEVATYENGAGVVEVPLDFEAAEANYLLLIFRKDSRGNLVRSETSVYYQKERPEDPLYDYWWRWWGSDLTFLEVVSPKSSYRVGEKVSLEVASPQDLWAYVTLERGRIYKKEWVFFKQGRSTYEFTAAEDLSPSITATFSFFAQGKYYIEGLELNIPALHKVLDVGVSLDKEKYRPSETAKIALTTRNARGEGVSANLSLAVVDRTIFALRPDAIPAIHTDFYFFRRRSTHASSSLTGIGGFDGGAGGGGGEEFSNKHVDTLYWNPNITTNAEGYAEVSVPLKGLEATWRVVALGVTSETEVGQDQLDFVAAD